MKAVQDNRRATIDRTTRFSGNPARRVQITIDKQTVSFTQIEQLPAATVNPVQNANGTFVSMTGYW